MDIRLSVAVMHHPARGDELLRRCILAVLDSATDDLVHDMGPAVDPCPDGPRSPWRTASKAWRETPLDCTHRLVLQDDALPCADFLPRLHTAIEAAPDVPLALFFGVGSFPLGIYRYADACRAGEDRYPLPHVGWVPCVALVLPRDQALDLGSFHLPHHDRPSVADDEVVMEWAHARGLTCYATCPSLVDHDDAAESLMGTDPTRIRRAVMFADELDRAIW